MLILQIIFWWTVVGSIIWLASFLATSYEEFDKPLDQPCEDPPSAKILIGPVVWLICFIIYIKKDLDKYQAERGIG